MVLIYDLSIKKLDAPVLLSFFVAQPRIERGTLTLLLRDQTLSSFHGVFLLGVKIRPLDVASQLTNNKRIKSLDLTGPGVEPQISWVDTDVLYLCANRLLA